MEDDGLNPAQREAVYAPNGPLLIFAGAGSGKTKVLTHRIAHLVRDCNVSPLSILAVTFTNKAAREMKERIEALVGGGATGMWLGTFHSIGVRILRRDGEAVGVPSDFSIYDEADKRSALTRALAATGIDAKKFPPSRVGWSISSAKNDMLSPAEFAVQAAGDWAEETVAKVYTAYEAEMRRANALDFDDLILMTVRLLEDTPEVLARYQARFEHLFVDEYQDTNVVQYRMVKALASLRGNLTVVGDDDQSIYGWRGADVRNILRFEEDYPDALRVVLDQNYRSTQTILDAAHAVISHNTERAEKKLWTDRGRGNLITVFGANDARDEAQTVARYVEDYVRSGGSTSDCAVLYRTNAQSRAFEEVLIFRGIPYRLVGGTPFYQRREIRDLLAYVRLLHNGRDASSFARIVNVPRRKIGDRSLAQLDDIARERQQSPYEVLADKDALTPIAAAARGSLLSFYEMCEDLRTLSHRVPLPDLLTSLVTRLAYDEYLNDGTPDGEDRINNVRELVNFTRDYVHGDPVDEMARFLEDVALVSDVDSYDNNAAGVTLITLHQVKGLEFPVVFMVGMEDGLLPHKRSLEEGESGIAEERRLTYVGITRAKKMLFMSYAANRFLWGAPVMTVPSQFLSDLPPDMVTGHLPRPRGVFSAGPTSGPIRPRAIAAAEAAAVSQEQVYQAGMRVNHPRFGDGAIVRSTMTKGGEEVIISFDDEGIKMFAVAEARLTPLS